jgi:hypothetical protein
MEARSREYLRELRQHLEAMQTSDEDIRNRFRCSVSFPNLPTGRDDYDTILGQSALALTVCKDMYDFISSLDSKDDTMEAINEVYKLAAYAAINSYCLSRDIVEGAKVKDVQEIDNACDFVINKFDTLRGYMKTIMNKVNKLYPND